MNHLEGINHCDQYDVKENLDFGSFGPLKKAAVRFRGTKTEAL